MISIGLRRVSAPNAGWRAGWVLGPILLVLACATSPPFPELTAWNDPSAVTIDVPEDERAMRDEVAGALLQLEEAGQLYRDDALERYLAGVLAALASAPIPPNAPVPVVYVVREPGHYGSSTPDGSIYVSTSLLAAIQNEAQLAGLLGHELAHILNRHALAERRYAKITGSTVDRMRLSRKLESAADRSALERMAEAGYDPKGLLELLGILQSEEGDLRGSIIEWESHPRTRERIGDLRSELVVARREGRLPEHPIAGKARYDEAIANLLLVAAEVDLEASHLDRAEAAIRRHLALRPESGRAYYLLAEHARRSEPEGHRSDAARRAYEKAVELSPDDPDAVRALGLLYREDGDAARAHALLSEYLSLAPDAADRPLIERYVSDEETNAGADPGR